MYSKVVEKLVGVSLSEVEYVLRDCALPEVKNAWIMKDESRSNWEWCKTFMEGQGKVLPFQAVFEQFSC